MEGTETVMNTSHGSRTSPVCKRNKQASKQVSKRGLKMLPNQETQVQEAQLKNQQPIVHMAMQKSNSCTAKEDWSGVQMPH